MCFRFIHQEGYRTELKTTTKGIKQSKLQHLSNLKILISTQCCSNSTKFWGKVSSMTHDLYLKSNCYASLTQNHNKGESERVDSTRTKSFGNPANVTI